jgi:cytochrome c-type biogenesis protein
MMIAVAVALWRGTMLPIGIPQPKQTGSTLSVFGLGVFSGAATACCAPVLAGAIALSATSGTIAGGLLLGIAYVAGMMAPLIPLALVYGKAKARVRDPKLTLRLAGRSKRIGLAALSGVVVFASFGVIFIVLALTGNSDTAPGFQTAIGRWMRELSDALDDVPNVVSLPALLAVLAGFAYSIVKKDGDRSERQEG